MNKLRNLNLEDDFMKDLRERIPEPDVILGKGLNIPFNNTNSGGRKILFGTQKEHVIPILDGEVAYIQTGAEQQFGDYSSSLLIADDNYKILAKIPKFSNIPDHHYYLIILKENNNELDVIERTSYYHLNESYGYLLNNTKIDSLTVGSEVCNGEAIKKSMCYDEYNNRKEGLNVLTAYMSLGQTEEDAIIISKSLQDKIITPLVHKVSIIANDNDIPLNLYPSENNQYKIFPDIGESVPNGILCATRRENKEESLYTQSYIRLKDIMMSDDKYTTTGKVVDINIYCNNPQNIQNNPYYSQIKYYYDEDMKFCQNLVNTINSIGGSYKLSYDLNQMYYICKKKLEGTQFIKDRLFSNIIIDMVLIEYRKIEVGDKLSDRYGGKGVVGAIWEDYRMPMLENGKRVELINNKSTCVNRLNPGQCFELSYNHISQRIIEKMNKYELDDDECMDLYLKFLHYTNPTMESYSYNYYNNLKEDDKNLFVLDIKSKDSIYQALKPISDSCDIDKLDALYKAFPWIKPYKVFVPIQDSNGKWNLVMARRDIVCGTKYILRLKQYAEEKFSTTSLSSTNIKNENSKSRANKMYRDPYTKTPVKFGEMESGNLGHMGFINVITGLLLYSTSPHARRMVGETLLTGDPYNIDVKLDKYSSNAEVQILNTYLKTIGLRLRFEKRPIVLKSPFIRECFIRYNEKPKSILMNPFFKVQNPTPRDFELAMKDVEIDHDINNTNLMSPFIKLGFYHVNYEQTFGNVELKDYEKDI